MEQLTALPYIPASFWILGKSGIGKHLQVQERIVDALRAGRPVLVFDAGRSYYKLCELLGGTYVSPGKGDTFEEVCFGQTPFVVYDLEHLDGFEGELPEPRLQRTPDFTTGLVVVDEAYQLPRRYPVLPVIVRGYVACGAHFIIVGQHEEDLALFKPLSADARLMTLTEMRG